VTNPITISDDRAARASAIDTARSFIVQAPAGSGKTELLVQRMLALLARASHPSEVLAITFTKKAAGEMRERVLAALRSASFEQAPIASPDRERWQLARSALARDRERDWRLLDRPSLLAIDTFDAFALRVLRATPYVSSFTHAALASLQQDASALYHEAARRAVLDLGDQAHANAASTLLRALDNRVDEIVRLLAALLSKRAQWLDHLADDSDEAVAEMRAAIVHCVESHIERLASVWPREFSDRTRALASVAADNLSALSIEFDEPHDASRETHASIVSRSNYESERIESLRSWQSLAGFLLTDLNAWRKQFIKTQGFPAPGDKGISADEKRQRTEAKQAIAQLLADLQSRPDSERLQSALTAVRGLPDAAAIANHDTILRATLRLLKIAAAELMLIERARAVTDFSGVSMAARLALLNHRDEVYSRFESTIAHILIDEYQDTNPAQASLVETLVEDWQPGDGRSLFLVGDPMQSIYAFRDADVALFARAWERGIGNVALTPITLSANYRSQPAIVDWVNRTMAPVFASSGESIATTRVHFAPAVAQNVSKGDDLVPEQWTFTSREDEARAIAGDIVQRRTERPLASVAILVRARPHAIEILRALREANIDFSAREMASWTDRPIVRDLLSLTYVIAQPADRLSWFAWLRSPMVGVSLSTLAALGARQETQRDDLPHVLRSEAFLESIDHSDRARIGNAMRVLRGVEAEANLLPLAARVHRVFLACGGNTIAASEDSKIEVEEFLALLDLEAGDSSLPPRDQFEATIAAQKRSFSVASSNTLETASAVPPVEILTIHKAKGLEWDVVYLPQLNKGTGAENRDLISWSFIRSSSSKKGLQGTSLSWQVQRRNASSTFLVAAKETRRSSPNSVYDFVRSLGQQARAEELKRLLYVATTRAKSRLVLSVTEEAHAATGSRGRGQTLASLIDWPEQSAQAGESSVEPLSPRIFLGASLTRLPYIPNEDNAALFSATATSPRSTFAALGNDSAGVDTVRQTDTRSEIAFGVVGHKLIEGLALSFASATPFSPSKDAVVRMLRSEGALESVGDESVAGKTLDDAASVLIAAVARMRTSRHFLFIHDVQHRDAADELALSQLRDSKNDALRVDRTFIDADGIRWIVDYKFAAVEGARDRFRSQLENYQRAFAEIEPTRALRCALYFPLSDVLEIV
jgi:ATP-dependent helicase/nuclease subunit A